METSRVDKSESMRRKNPGCSALQLGNKCKIMRAKHPIVRAGIQVRETAIKSCGPSMHPFQRSKNPSQVNLFGEQQKETTPKRSSKSKNRKPQTLEATQYRPGCSTAKELSTGVCGCKDRNWASNEGDEPLTRKPAWGTHGGQAETSERQM